MDGAWTPERNDSGQCGDGYVTAEKATHQWEKNLDGKWDRKGNVGEPTSRRCERLTSRFEINGLTNREYPEVELSGLKVDFQWEHDEEGKF